MVGLSTPSGEHSHPAAPPPDPSVPTPCREAPAPELPVRFAAARIDRQAAACRQRIVTDRVREEGKCAPPPGFCPGYPRRPPRPKARRELPRSVFVAGQVVPDEEHRAGDGTHGG